MIRRVVAYFVLLFFIFSLYGCGSISRARASFVGYSEVVVDGVVYIQFPSGVTVKYNKDGTIYTK